MESEAELVGVGGGEVFAELVSEEEEEIGVGGEGEGGGEVGELLDGEGGGGGELDGVEGGEGDVDGVEGVEVEEFLKGGGFGGGVGGFELAADLVEVFGDEGGGGGGGVVEAEAFY